MKCPCCQRSAPANKPGVVAIIAQHEEEDAYLNAIVLEVVALLAEQAKSYDKMSPRWTRIDSLLKQFRAMDVETAKRQHAVDELLDLERSLNR